MVPNEALLRVKHRYTWNRFAKSLSAPSSQKSVVSVEAQPSAKIGYRKKSDTFVRRVMVDDVDPVTRLRQKFDRSRSALYSRIAAAVGDDCGCD